MIEYSGQNWYERSNVTPTIAVIEPPAVVEGQEKPKRDPNAVPFGFARVLHEKPKPKRKPKPRVKRKARPKGVGL